MRLPLRILAGVAGMDEPAQAAEHNPEIAREVLPPRIDVEVGDVMGGVVIRTPVD